MLTPGVRPITRDFSLEMSSTKQTVSQASTIVVGRQSFSRLRDLFHYHVANELVRKGQGFSIWVVE